MNIAVVMGGYSDESVISLRSGQLILKNLDKNKY
ncbi:MAG: D-alanine--D-alanine ligase, partial [Flavobacterium sp.]